MIPNMLQSYMISCKLRCRHLIIYELGISKILEIKNLETNLETFSFDLLNAIKKTDVTTPNYAFVSS